MMKRWMLMPLKDIGKIQERLELVDFFIRDPELRTKLIHHIKACGDIERILSRLPSKKINPREVHQLGRGLHEILNIRQLCAGKSEPLLKKLSGLLDPCTSSSEKISLTN